jgi:hypothetical protein
VRSHQLNPSYTARYYIHFLLCYQPPFRYDFLVLDGLISLFPLSPALLSSSKGVSKVRDDTTCLPERQRLDDGHALAFGRSDR